MPNSKRTLSVSQAAVLCGVGRTTVGYWIRAKKLHAHRIGRNYAIPIEDLLIFLQNSGQNIPPELIKENSKGPVFRRFQNCWQYWKGCDPDRMCQDCIVFKHQVHACFTARGSGFSDCSECETCHYYRETFFSRIQFIHQINLPAAVLREQHVWGGNSLCADMCDLKAKDLIGIGVEKIVHSRSLAMVIEAIRKKALDDSPEPMSCSIYLNNRRENQKRIDVSVYPLIEPAGTFLVLADPKPFG